MSRPHLPSPEDNGNSPTSSSSFTLPPIRSLHATPKPTQLPPTPCTLPPQLQRHGQEHNHNHSHGLAGPPAGVGKNISVDFTTPVQPRTRQPQPFSSTSIDRPAAHQTPGMFPSHLMTTPVSNAQHAQPHHGYRAHGDDDNLTRHQTPNHNHIGLGLGPSLVPSTASASKKKQHPPPHHATPADTPGPFNSGYAPITLRTPVSALSTRTMGRSISTPTLPINGGTPYTLSASAASTRYSPSSDSQQSTSVSRSGVRGDRGQLSFSPSPTPSSAPSIDLAGIQPPAPFPGAYPLAYTRKDPVPTEDGEPEVAEGKRSGRQGAPSWNPWDYVLGEVPGGEQGPNQTPVKDEDSKGNKIRRRFTKRELEALEVLWSISKSPSKYERQRLGAWLGVKTKHITVWFQNRRQEEKRYLREGAPVEPPPPSRSNRGTFDPVTGKWRPVPLSCISGLQPPPEEKSAVVRSISVGDLTRDMYFAQHPHTDAHLPTPTPASGHRAYTNNGGDVTPVPKRGTGNSLDDVLHARDSGFGQRHQYQYRRGSGEPSIKSEGQERIREILALMPSDPPSMDLAEMAADEEESEGGDADTVVSDNSPKRKTLGSGGGAMGLARMLNGPSGSGTSLGRTTSLDLLASKPKPKRHSTSNKTSGNGNGNSGPFRGGPLGAINPNIPSDRQSLTLGSSGTGAKAAGSLKHTLPLGQPLSSKRARVDTGRSRPTPTFRHKDSFSRSQSAAVLESPRRERARGQENNPDRESGEMKTPGFTRSFSFSSTASDGVAITPDSAVLSRKVNGVEGRGPVRGHGANGNVNGSKAPLGQGRTDGKKGEGEERDAEVLGAAEKLLQLLGGA